MSEYRLLSIEIRTESDVVLVRQRIRRIGRLLTLGEVSCTRLATAASEVARNAYQYAGGGQVRVLLSTHHGRANDDNPMLLLRVTDEGPGIEDVDTILRGDYRSRTGLGAGLAGAQRLLDHFEIESKVGRGTRVELGLQLPAQQESAAALAGRLGGELARLLPPSPYEELHQQSRELLEALNQSNRALQMREDILAVVSHDLRNPLSVIGMSAAIALRCDGVRGDERALQAISRIDRSVKQMERLIADLLDVASLQAGKLSVEMRHYDAQRLIDEACESHRQLADEHGLTLTLVADVDGVGLMVDPQRVMQVFGNLLGNAMKFSPTGEAIELRAGIHDGEVRFAIADSGPGIHPDDLPRLFEPYFSAREHSKKGTGLGLFICKGIVDAHGGRIWAESEPGAGTTVRFTLPVAAGQTPPNTKKS